VDEEAQPVDEEKSPVDPHPVDENPEEHIGDAMLDPWKDETQTDWPNNEEETS